jgi:NAD(P)-dependent dehydrogenase (short-subunit alcohol dehydrogenase family)
MTLTSPFSLEGKTILVTGASSGIGKETAVTLSAARARLVLSGRNEERLQETFSLLSGTGHQIMAADLLDFSGLPAFAAKMPMLSGVVHSAGVTGHLPAKFIQEADIHQLMGINYTAPVLLTSALLRSRKIEAKASLVFLSSITTKYPYFGGALYGSSKAALEAYSRVLSIELASKGIRSNCVAPSFVKTPMVEGAGETISNEVLEKFEKMMPLGFGEPADVSHAILYLLSDASRWVTGSTMTLGGG